MWEECWQSILFVCGNCQCFFFFSWWHVLYISCKSVQSPHFMPCLTSLLAATPRLSLNPGTPSHFVTCTNLLCFLQVSVTCSGKCCCFIHRWGHIIGAWVFLSIVVKGCERSLWVICESPMLSEIIHVRNCPMTEWKLNTPQKRLQFLFLKPNGFKLCLRCTVP